MISADCTVVDDNVPSPQSYSVPLSAKKRSQICLVEDCHAFQLRTFFTSNRFFPFAAASDSVTIFLPLSCAELVAAGASVMSTSAMMTDGESCSRCYEARGGIIRALRMGIS